MIRVLVVDDEAIVLESVTQVLTSHFEDLLIETARNSREGLIKVEHFRPHLIMSDIKMPGMNGLEFIERIRKVNSTVKIVIVSAYDHFEYAKEAVRFGVEDYLLKPLTKNKLIEVVESISTKIKEEEEARNKELDNIEKYYQSVQLVESNFFNSILLNRNLIKYMAHYREILELPFTKGVMVTIEFDKLEASGELNTYSQKLYDCADFLKTHIKYHTDAIVSNPFINRVFAYIENEVDRTFWNNLVPQIMERFKLRVRIGLGTSKCIEQISESYVESLLTMRMSNNAVCSMQDIVNIEASFERFDSSRDALYNDFIHRNKSFKSQLKGFETEYIKMLSHKTTHEYAVAILTELMVLFFDRCGNRIGKNKQDEVKTHYLSMLAGASAMAKLHYFEKTVTEWFSMYAKMQNENFNALTVTALDYLRANYKDEVTLEDLALALNVTPQYLSKIFKEDTGTTFKEYLTELRIEASKMLLKENEMSIKDICYQVGYNDTSYFIRAFKKFEGITPKDFQRVSRSS